MILENRPRVAASITKGLRKQGINIEYHRFWVEKIWVEKNWMEKKGILEQKKLGHIVVVVRDEDGDKAKEQIDETGRFCDLGIREINTIYYVQVHVEDEPGELDEVVSLLAQQEVNLEYSEGPFTYLEGDPPQAKQCSILMFDCPRNDYDLAKRYLGKRIIKEPAFFLDSAFKMEPFSTFKA
ncbi:hypothetical protein L0Y69_00520 [bacterium]|nr:hypothetical protein [bacterium]